MTTHEMPSGYGLFKSLRYHAVIARELRKRPEPVLARAWATMERWGWLDPGHEAYHAGYARQWRLALDRGAEHVAELIERPPGDEQADWMRSCTPLVGILDRSVIRALQHQWRREYRALRGNSVHAP
ncbi:hypothetical protein [Desulfonatronum thioautotrophicum]|uniref:hypothetical protein n=1 Tax=Desulfonatronum thioautotrophicum TaxID=617001 RepID=UPI0005EAD96F|nr:hypothetical protein [Desulfonatronum thioautotrophicum]